MVARDRVKELERLRGEVSEEIRVASARLAGIDAELRALRGGDRAVAAERSQADTILDLLRGSRYALGPKEIALALGMDDNSRRSVGGLLNHLKTRGLAMTTERGRWVATGGST